MDNVDFAEVLKLSKELKKLKKKISDIEDNIENIIDDILESMNEELDKKGIQINRCSTMAISRFIITFKDNFEYYMGFDIDLENMNLEISYTTNQYIKKLITIDENLSAREIINTIQESKMSLLEFNMKLKSDPKSIIENS